MVQRDGDLNQPLEEKLVRRRRRAPGVFQDLVGIVKRGTVKEVDADSVEVYVGGMRWPNHKIKVYQMRGGRG